MTDVPTLVVLDVSANQVGTIDFRAVQAAGVSGVVTKSSEGLGYTDPDFAVRWPAIAAAGLWRAAYHFAHPEWNDPLHEAAWFLSVVPALAPYDAVALDIETGPSDGSDVSAWALSWLEHVAPVLGVTPLVYTFMDFAETRLKDPALAPYPLWLAVYSSECPPACGVWSTVTLWQHTDSASYPGLSPVDASLIARDLAGLRALGKAPGAPRKCRVNRDMMLRSAPDAWHVYVPVQMVYAGATLDIVGPEEHGWLCVHAGTKTGYILAANCTLLS